MDVATNLDLDDRLIEAARREGKHRTKKDAVTAALREYVEHRRRLRLVEMFGSVDFDPAYDYKAARRKR
ncbi:MAG: type II toxin-antitoxin system VapB family antitoxin [Terriglobales bacterium]